MAKTLLVCHAILPANIKDSAKAVEMELIQLLDVVMVAGLMFQSQRAVMSEPRLCRWQPLFSV